MNIDTNLLGFSKNFDDPFMLPSSHFIPETLTTALDLSVFLYYLNSTYRKATEQVVSHFVTDLIFSSEASQDENAIWKDYFINELQVLDFLKIVGNEFFCYGNVFIYLYRPFTRYLCDKENKRFFELNSLLPIAKKVSYNYQTLEYEMMLEGKKRIFSLVDIVNKDNTRLALRRIDPREVTIEPGFASGKHSYIFSIPEVWKQAVKKNIFHTIQDLPIDFLKAIALDKHYRFNSDELFHMKNESVMGVANEGWGIPEPILNYRMLHMLQVYYKVDESVAREFMMPFRIFSPVPQGGVASMDSMGGMSMSGEIWRQQMKNMIANRRADPEAIHAFPFPIEYQAHGGEGKSLTPKDLIEFQTNELLNATGVPAEFYRGTLQYQAAPLALRTFESKFSYIYNNFNSLVKWVGRKVKDFTKMDMAIPTLERPSVAEDVETKAILQGLYQTGAISNRTLFTRLNIGDPEKERVTRIEEEMEYQMAQAKAEAEAQKKMQAESMESVVMQDIMAQQQAAAGGMPGTTPMVGGGNPMDVMGDAERIAQEWLMLPTGERRKAMMDLEATNENLYAMAKEKMEEIRAMGASQGRQMVSGGM